MSLPPRSGRRGPEHDILLRNRTSHLRDRDDCYRQALEDLGGIAQRFHELRASSGGLEQLRQVVERLAQAFKRALYHAVLAAGGDFGRTRMVGITREEMVFTDFLKTLYSAARNIESYLSHELMLQRFAESEDELEPFVREYIQQTKSYDQDIIVRNLDLMVSRAAIFNKTFLDPGRRPVEEHATVRGSHLAEL